MKNKQTALLSQFVIAFLSDPHTTDFPYDSVTKYTKDHIALW